jgi:transposase
VPAALKITLTKEEDRTLKELESSQQVPRRTKQRATALRLNSRGWTVKAIANYLECASSTVRQAIHRWELNGLAGLWEAQGRGRKATWNQEDWQALETWLSQERSYSARQLSQLLATQRQVRLGAEQVRRILLKKNGVGKG